MTRTGVSAKYEPNKCIGKVCPAFTARRLVDLDLGAPFSLSRRSVGPSKPLRFELPSCGHCYAKLPRREACESPVRLDVFRSNPTRACHDSSTGCSRRPRAIQVSG